MGQAIYLTGAAADVGTQLGQLQRQYLVERTERLARRIHAADLDTSTFAARLDTFEQCLLAAAPHWLEEAQATANAAGLECRQLLLLNMALPELAQQSSEVAPLVPRTLEEARAGDHGIVNPYEAQGTDPAMGEGECTSFFVLGDATTAGETLLHKNRDSYDEVQHIYIKHIDGQRRFVGSADVGNLGTAHLHTEDLFAGANNTGSPLREEHYQQNALNDCHVLRYVGERCANLDDIVPCLQELQARRWMGGGGSHQLGSIFLFADAARGLIVEATSYHLEYQWFEEDNVEVRANHFEFPAMQQYCNGQLPGSAERAARAREILEPLEGLMDISTCGEVSRDRVHAPYAICRNPSDGLGTVTVSTATATISPHDDRRCQTHFRNGHPGYCPPVILSPLDLVSDTDLASGAHCDHWRGFRGWV